MKRILYVLAPVLLIILTAGLYFTVSDFNQKNIEGIRFNDKDLDIDDPQVQAVATLLYQLEAFDKRSEESKGLEHQIEIQKTFGTTAHYSAFLDDDYSFIVIEDKQTNQAYQVDHPLTAWFYMQEDSQVLYDYQEIPEAKLYVDGLVKSTWQDRDWRYELGDGIWHAKQESKGNINRFQIKENTGLTMQYALQPASSELKVTFQDEIIYTGPLEDFRVTKEGLYTCELSANWQQKHAYGETLTRFELAYDVPIEFTVTKSTVEQGEVVVVQASHVNDPSSLKVTQDYLEGLSFGQLGEGYACVLPTTYSTRPGQYKITVSGDDVTETMEFEVVERAFEIQRLTVDEKTTASTQTAEAYAEYNKYYKTALLKDAYQSAENYLLVPVFQLPTSGRLTTEFGVNRYVNGKKTSYHHAGLDIANDQGTEIVATYDGVVVLSMPLQVTGNTVVISHGNGLFSSYFHMYELSVEEGQLVRKGERVGAIGTTGFSTGPHLHFGISYYQMNLEPGQFIFGKKVTYDNYKTLFEQEEL